MFSSAKDKTNPKDDTKIYGCAVTSMDIYNTGAPFENDPKYINFNSEVVVRKGDEGWVINSKLDNYSQSQTDFDYILTTYKYEENQWKAKNKKWWKDNWMLDGDAVEHKISDDNNNDIYVVWTYNDKLVIKTPKESWWNGAKWISNTGNHKIVRKTKTETKNWSGVWIEDSARGKDSWIFENIELYIKEKKNSLMFCEGEDGVCFNTSGSSNKPQKSDKWDSSNSWTEILGSQPQTETDTVKTMLITTVKPIIDKIKSSRGTWLDLESVCNLKGIRNLNASQKQQLSMFCTNGKKS